MRSTLRDPISALTHLAGAAAAISGLPFLLLRAPHSLTWVSSILVYGASLVALFGASSLYHALRASPKTTLILRKLDHSAIYLMIDGTYNPFCANAFSGFWNWGLLAIIWGLAGAGILVKLFFMRSQRWVTAGLYVAMGWLVIFAAQEMARTLAPNTIFWLAAGGVIYTAGAGIYGSKKLDFFPGRFGFHEVWHLFVLLGAAAHYIAVASLVV